MLVKSIMNKENIDKCLSYVHQKYQADFLELMQNIEIILSESLPTKIQEGQPNDKKIIGHTTKYGSENRF
jgi:hypothetical protein